MAPVRNSKSPKTTGVHYDPRDTRVAGSQSPKSVWALNPSITLDYIPMAERWNCRWLADHTLQCPKRGNLFWIGKGPRPNSDKAMQATKLFVIEEWMGNEVEHLVKEVQKVKGMKCINLFSTPHLIRRLEEWEKEGKERAVPKWVD
ncbi:hypothetical protein RhiJN_01512 [Ceratobasidium sp. AG-Ba]|nr:hypothetical protein RhiJN_01512 [Ceratobasidium sp. AG-Ba]